MNNNQGRTWNNRFTMIYYSLCFGIFPVGLISVFINDTKYIHALWIGIVLLWLVYELTVYSYIRVTLRDKILLFERPLARYGLLFRKRTRRMTIHPDDWTEVYSYTNRGSYSYYFRKDQTAAYFVLMDGIRLFDNELADLFPGRKKHVSDFPRAMKRKLRRAEPGRVF
jgi:hypothetical protein